MKGEGVRGLRRVFEAGVQWIHLGRCVGDESGGGFPPGCLPVEEFNFSAWAGGLFVEKYSHLGSLCLHLVGRM